MTDSGIINRSRSWRAEGATEGTLYTSRNPLQHLLSTGVPNCEEPGSAHEQTCKISREELPNPIKQRRDELRKRNFFVSLPLQRRLLILVDSCAEWGWPDTLGNIQGEGVCFQGLPEDVCFQGFLLELQKRCARKGSHKTCACKGSHKTCACKGSWGRSQPFSSTLSE